MSESNLWRGGVGERRERAGLKSSGSSYTFKLTITPFDHMIFLMSFALIISPQSEMCLWHPSCLPVLVWIRISMVSLSYSLMGEEFSPPHTSAAACCALSHGPTNTHASAHKSLWNGV